MKTTQHIPETLMSASDKEHIEWIAGRHDVRFFDRMAAMAVMANAGQMEMLSSMVSFSAMGASGKQALYLDPDETKSADEAYFVALHELGHSVLGHHGKTSTPETEIAAEIEAWEWALNHAQHQPEDDTLVLMQDALATYTDNAEADLRPDSILGTSLPDNWVKHGWHKESFEQALLKAEEAGEETVILSGNTASDKRTLSTLYARMLLDWIKYSIAYERERLQDNVAHALDEVKRAFDTSKLSGKN